MKDLSCIAAVVALALLVQPVIAQQTETSPATGAKAQQAPQTPAEFDKQFAKMQEHMAKMQEEMAKISQTQDPQARQRLLQEHWSSMQNAMTMMRGAWGGMMGPGCCGAGGQTRGGHMMGGAMMGGPMMMWGDYRKLTPEQLKERQYMMDRWMPMQQMMMDQMMQHQYWMMQPQQQPGAPDKK